MKHSIRKLMLVSFTGLIFVMLISIFCINSWFLEQYYIANKQPALREVYDVLEEAVEEDVLTAEGTRNTLRGMMERGNIRFCVFERRNMDMALASASCLDICWSATQTRIFLRRHRSTRFQKASICKRVRNI